MRADTFNEILEARLAMTRDVLASKAAEYALGGDRLHNFKEAAQLQGVTPAEALRGMWAKHAVSVCDLVREHAAGKRVTGGLINEKLGDAINYLILLEAVLKERPDAAAAKAQCHWASDADDDVTQFVAEDTFTKNEDGYYYNADGVYLMDWARGVFEANPPPTGWHQMLVSEDSPHYVKKPQT